jgi:hypothetical protein
MHQNVTSLAAAQQKNSLMFVGLQRIYIIHPLTGVRDSCVVVRSPSYHYLALCLYQLMKAAWGAVGVEVLLCMWDSGASFPLYTQKFKSEPR